MKEYNLHRLMNDTEVVEETIRSLQEKGILHQQKPDPSEIRGHLLKARHNLRFVSENAKLKFLDWAVTGCYYASYHAALALIMTKGFSSKSHLATLCVIISQFYKKGLDQEDVELFSQFLDYQDVLFYVESKNKRETASYSTTILFDQKEVEKLRIKATLFVDKIETIMGEL